jgi:hypothetical protein
VLVNDSRATPLGKGRCKSVVVAWSTRIWIFTRVPTTMMRKKKDFTTMPQQREMTLLGVVIVAAFLLIAAT